MSAGVVRNPCILGGSPTKGNKSRSGYLTLAFLGAHKRAELLRNPCVLGGLQRRGTKSEVATSPLPSQRPKRGRDCYVPPVFLGVPEHGFKKGPHRASGKKASHGGPR